MFGRAAIARYGYKYLTKFACFGTSADDAERLRAFADANDRWQHNPDFREAQVEYVELGSDSMRTKTAFMNTTDAVMRTPSVVR